MQKHQQLQHVTFTTVLALANKTDPICVVLPKVDKASTIVTAACCCRWNFHLKTLPMEMQLYFHKGKKNQVWSRKDLHS
jgi:hypothetical protein